MHLTENEIELYYRLWYGLVWGINKKHRIIPGFKKPVDGVPVDISVEEFKKARDAMWDNPEWIDQFLVVNGGEFSEAEREIIAGWRRYFIKGRFIVIKHLTGYSVLMSTDNEPYSLYGVCGISDNIQDSFPYSVPFVAELVLLPFGDKIIYDSIANVFNVSLGPGIKATIKESYDQIKTEHGIYEKLDGTPPKPKKKPKAKPKPVPAAEALPPGVKVPKKMAAKYNEVASIISQFAREKLDDEYNQIALNALAKLCRRRPSPLEKGRARTWACGIVYAICSVNFIFDKTQPYHMKSTELAGWFGLAQSTASGKGSEIKKLLDISYANPDFLLKRLIEDNPLIWFVQIGDFVQDIRTMPRELQEIAFRKGIIPYIPDDKKQT
jgi:hypothetical protein